MKHLYLVSYYDRDDGQNYQLVVADTYENAVQYVRFDFEEDLLPNDCLQRNLVLVNKDGDWFVKDPAAQETEFFDSQLVGDYNIESISLYEGMEVDEPEE